MMNIHPTAERDRTERDRTGCGMVESRQRLLQRNALQALEYAERPTSEIGEDVQVLKEVVRLMLRGEL